MKLSGPYTVKIRTREFVEFNAVKRKRTSTLKKCMTYIKSSLIFFGEFCFTLKRLTIDCLTLVTL